MSFRPRWFCFILLFLLVLLPSGAYAQAGAVVRGTVADPDSAVIPGATVTLTPLTGTPLTAQSGSDGNYVVNAVPAGTYAVTVTMNGFASFVRQGVKIAAGQALTINAKLLIQDEKQEIQVTAQANTLSVDQDSNASSTVISGKDLDALSDDPDELSSELSALAGPAAGPNGGQIYIDGFTGGQLPPKSSIREIRVNQNPFSAQYDRPGFGRVEIFTKPGTDKFHGQFQLNGNDKSFNTGTPLSGAAQVPGYHTILTFGNFSGPINKNASFTLGGSLREIQDNAIINPSAIYAMSATSGVPCAPGQIGCSSFTNYTSVVSTPQTRYDISPRVDLALGQKNTLTARYRYESDSRQNQGVGGNNLIQNGYSTNSSENTVQISDTQIISPRIINEIHFEYQREYSQQTPQNTAVTINVQGAFIAGGANAGASTDIQNHIEFQNYTSVALAKHFMRFGGRLRSTGEQNTTSAGTNGSFTYNSIADYQAGALPSQFTITRIATPTLSVRTTDLGLYAEDDWKARPNLTLSYGLRFETQNYIHDKADFAPRVSFAYGLGSSKGSPRTVVRGGFGLFYDRFMLTNQLNLLRNNGVNQQQTIIQASAATAFPTTCTPNSFQTGCTGNSALTTQTIQPNLHAPYVMQTNVGVDEQLFKGATISVNYQNIRGIHQFVGANVNTPNPTTGIYPYAKSANGTNPVVYQYLSEGLFNQNQIITNINYRGSRHVSLFGYYVLNFAKSDTSGISSFLTQPYNIKADYGRASFDVRNRVFLGGNITLPHLISVSPFLVAVSGTPFNITTGADQNGDSEYNDRAAFAPAGVTPTNTNGLSNVKTLAGCGTFYAPAVGTNYTEIPSNYCTGPSSFTLNLRVQKTFGFGASTAAPQGGGGQDGGGPGGGGRGPGGGGRGGMGGGGGRGGAGGGGGASSGKRYNLSIGAQAQNVFNVVDRAQPVGTLSSAGFGTSQLLAGTIFTTQSAVRRVQLQASFTF